MTVLLPVFPGEPFMHDVVHITQINEATTDVIQFVLICVMS